MTVCAFKVEGPRVMKQFRTGEKSPSFVIRRSPVSQDQVIGLLYLLKGLSSYSLLTDAPCFTIQLGKGG